MRHDRVRPSLRSQEFQLALREELCWKLQLSTSFKLQYIRFLVLPSNSWGRENTKVHWDRFGCQVSWHYFDSRNFATQSCVSVSTICKKGRLCRNIVSICKGLLNIRLLGTTDNLNVRGVGACSLQISQ